MVEVQVSEANSGLTEIRVSDQGLGVEPQHREMVFGPFKRLNPLSEFPGSGLGLSTCRRLVESIGGTIRFEDCEKGAVVVVRFPGNELEG
jgi:signal transduction histidine kinase